MRFGIHVPRQRSLTTTAEYARDAGCQSFQIFSGNPVGWAIGALRPPDRDGFRNVVERASMGPILVHAPYLINIATGDRRLRRLSEKALVDAMVRASDLGAGPVVVHAGNHKGAGPRLGVERGVSTLAAVLERAPEGCKLAIEGGAGKGTEIGTTFEQLRDLVSPFPAGRVGVLLDTAHLWALGYDLRSEDVLAAMLDEVAKGPGFDRLMGVHGNDSSADLGSRRDRHALWTEGRMGRKALRNLVGAPELAGLPFVFEIPGETPDFDRRRLRSMRRMERRVTSAARGTSLM